MAYRHKNKGIPKDCYRTLVPTSDNKKNAQVSLNESVNEEQLMILLKRYDTNGDGRLSKQELQDAFKSLGSTFPAWRAWRALHHADANGDGCVNEDEFGELVKYVVKRGYALA